MSVNKILSPHRVRELMAQMTKEQEAKNPAPPVGKKQGNVMRACEMIVKTGCSIPAAAQSWGVKTKSIIKYAKENNITVVHQPAELDIKAKEIVNSGAYRTHIPRGLRQRVAYYLSFKYSVSEACRLARVCRRGLYYYCQRYDLPTPLRATGGMS
jgi:hypothetical protein